MPHKYTPQEQIIAFWNKVNKDGSIPAHCPELGQCWEWVGSRHRQGYGNTSKNGKYVLSHRMSWELTFGNIPDGLCVLHKCDNTACCNPNHLFLGTQLDNMKDRSAKGRQARILGEDSPSHKLSDKQVEEMRQLRATSGMYYKDIAREYGISIGQVGKLITRRFTKR